MEEVIVSVIRVSQGCADFEVFAAMRLRTLLCGNVMLRRTVGEPEVCSIVTRVGR
jgi:hypothetical protein